MKTHIIKNCGIFGGAGNIYAPLYRQASFYTITLAETAKRKTLQTSFADVLAAFDFYLGLSGRPFVLAGHSQGSRLLRELIKARFKDAALGHRLIAAYLIGAEVTARDVRDYPWLKPAQNAADTGVFISYNAQAGSVGDSPIFERGGAVCINPLTWTQEPGAAELNEGAVFFGPGGVIKEEIPRFTGASIQNGALIAMDADIEKYSVRLMPRGVYHMYDYEFFYRNLQSNFKTRLNVYLNQ
jgi:hypothetical protein